MINGFLAKFRAVLIQDKGSRLTFTFHNLLSIILLSSVGVTALVWGMRELKWLQSGELKIYDRMLQFRPQEPLDRRILLVTITQEDLTREKWPLSDQTINKLLEKLQSDQARVIGLNIYRHEQKNLAANLPKANNIIGTCLLSNIGRSEVPPPPNFFIDNIGFDDVVTDNSTDQVLRRSLLFSDSTEKDRQCKTQFSFGALLAISYLEKQGIEYTFTKNKELQIGKTLFPRLDKNAGSYQDTDDDGYQILLNYRDPNHFVQQVTLTQVLTNQVNPNWVQDRLVIVGTTAASVHPGYYTPYGSLSDQPARIPRVFIHAQIASQIISTVLDGRPLIYYWPDWAELLWIWICALLGAVLAWQWRHPLMLLIVEVFILIGVMGIAAGFFLQAIWIPLLTPSLALVISGFAVMTYTSYQTQQQNQAILFQVEQQEEAIAQLSLLLDQTTEFPSQFNNFDFSEISIFNTNDLLLSGRFKISQSLGSGGFGRTYLAEDRQRYGNPICVVKQLMPARQDPRFLEVARRLFNTEAEILAILGKHPQIPELFAAFAENNEFYLVQEYIPGHTLSEELPPEQGVRNETYVVDMLQEVLEILVFIHGHYVIHRDIKPTNIIRCNGDNRLVLIDFGAVKLIQPQIDEKTELATVAIGTRGYSPPEQFAGHPRLSSDIYALGMIGIQAITGIPPQEFIPHPETGNIMWRQRTDVSDELATILDKMVCYHFSDRYQSAALVLQDLKSLSINY
ncbi:CHASE2 domain-containing serine/threonine-protein kinase [Anabaena sp. UHCC 0451]|uniref:CHASE2 domain-containing protein n=1 Tax=Anabaena sp. UHCC 0451 TaxID=2055235 RepID=UPI002B20C934|nr:CHASE2 domain-containing serine/threonine-protein kinase [Anabaena sp. UHCC 0451]MEA5579427.1 CHASE2 domain-containing serine/threonine-protein kinase [Anabaena sp. UHCC 0451]